MDDHDNHNEEAMLDIAQQAYNMAGALCHMYGQCEYHTALTQFRFWLDRMDDAIADLEEEDDEEAMELAQKNRGEIAELLRSGADIIEKRED
ncbi:MAG TPA: hypothetical protein VIG24_08945 [Acidimicrobiia bacterium]